MPRPCARRVVGLLVLSIIGASAPARAEGTGGPPVLAGRILVPAIALASPSLAPAGALASPSLAPTDTLAAGSLSPAPVGVQLESAARPVSPTQLAASTQPALPAPRPGIAASARQQLARPRALVPLYVSFAALQGMDAFTTVQALGRGAVEANPLLGGVAGNRGALFAVKASTTAGTIWLSERLWRKNRVAAIALMAALNGTYAVIVAHNRRVGR